MKAIFVAVMVGLCTVTSISAQPAGANDLLVRVVDVGAGLCCVVQMPGGHYMIYDAGDYSRAVDDILEIIPEHDTIDLVVLSHSDADHLGAVDRIFDS